MKFLILKVYSIISSIYYKIRYRIYIQKSSIFLTKLNIKGYSNKIHIDKGTLSNSSIFIQGENNSTQITGVLYKSEIRIYGKNNKLILNDKCSLHYSTIIIRGENCIIKIGDSTTFGSVYMVCMGQGNIINIGKECMFADHIDIWNTDSHPIMNMEKDIINPSLPIYIGDHVWIGKGCKILKGVKVGSNAIVGMNSLIVKDINPNTLNVGSPTKCIKEGVNWDKKFITI